jgi:predicted alpha/beta-fold hydrolase
LSDKNPLLGFCKSLLSGFSKDASFLSRAFVVAVLCGVLAFTASTSYIYSNQEFLIFKFPPQDFSDTIKIEHHQTEMFHFSSQNQQVFGWHFKKENAKKTLIYFYGVGDNVKNSIPKIKWFASNLNCSVICCDYPGYGKSAGKPSEASMDIFINDLHKILKDKGLLDSQKIMCWGYSLGGALALKLNQKVNTECTVLESTFSSISQLAIDQFPFVLSFIPFNIITRNTFNNIELIKNVKNPIIIIHSRRDQAIPHHHAGKLIESSDHIVEFLETDHPHNIQYPRDLTQYKKVLRKHLPNWCN